MEREHSRKTASTMEYNASARVFPIPPRKPDASTEVDDGPLSIIDYYNSLGPCPHCGKSNYFACDGATWY